MSSRNTVWITGDQLLEKHPVLEHMIENYGEKAVIVLMVESHKRASKLPYHRQKIALLFSAMRHYADTLRARGLQVNYRSGDIADGVAAHVAEFQPEQLHMMAAAEFDARAAQERIAAAVSCKTTIHANSQFLLGQYHPFPDAPSDKRIIMENFYRAMRRHFRILVDDADQPAGGKWNFDQENRKPLPKADSPPLPPVFPPDEITQTVLDQVAGMNGLTGSLYGFCLPVTHTEARQALDAFIKHRLPRFGDYEDAMTTRSVLVYHSGLSAALNIGLLTPMQMVDAAVAAYERAEAPLNAVEGFVRQIIGWREYMYWMYWRMMPGLKSANAWEAARPMPAMFWTGETDMRCISHVTERLLDAGYSHHIERLMVICNFCLLAGIDPMQVSIWFLSLYVDAYEWVVLPNVIGMGLNADGGQTATKPYIASANYINKMSDYCTGCRFNPKLRTGENACPYNYLYWNFILTHEQRLRANPRLGQNVLGLRHLDQAERQVVQAQAREFLEKLEYYESFPPLGQTRHN
jgi:deoxyribodipyrimidine photolyase-related protein